jgi:hypothetical protein
MDTYDSGPLHAPDQENLLDENTVEQYIQNILGFSTFYDIFLNTMQRWQNQIEEMFRSPVVIFFRHRIKTISLCLLLFAALLSFLPNLKFNTSTESFFHEDDQAIIDYT